MKGQIEKLVAELAIMEQDAQLSSGHFQSEIARALTKLEIKILRIRFIAKFEYYCGFRSFTQVVTKLRGKGAMSESRFGLSLWEAFGQTSLGANDQIEGFFAWLTGPRLQREFASLIDENMIQEGRELYEDARHVSLNEYLHRRGLTHKRRLDSLAEMVEISNQVIKRYEPLDYKL